MLLSEIARVTHAEFYGQDVSVSSVSTDTRAINSGDLFLALRGARFDGHDYLAEAVAKACVAVVVDHYVPSLQIPQLVVVDTRIALGRLAEAWRLQFQQLKVFAITGSCGKTTVKDLLASICSQVAPTLATLGNLNNDIGVPLTLLRLNETHRFAVLEVGTNAPGEIAYSAQLVHPDAAVITNAEAVHLAGLGNVANVAKEKGAIYHALHQDGFAVINLDDAHGVSWYGEMSVAGKKIIGCAKHFTDFPRGIMPDVWLENSVVSEQGDYQFDIVSRDSRVTIHAALPGAHNVTNAMFAAALAKSVNIDNAHIKAGLENVKSAPGRLNLYPLTRCELLLVDDTYNANPHSVKAAIDFLAQYPEKNKVLILGDMAELGADVQMYHWDVGHWAKKQGINTLFAVGHYAESIAEGFGEGARCFNTQSELIGLLPQLLIAGMIVLVKGSRSAKMEVVVQAIRTLERGDA